jgi:hypothetical protein
MRRDVVNEGYVRLQNKKKKFQQSHYRDNISF